MGRRYAGELEQLSTTYQWALSAEIERLAQAVAAASANPLVAVGSGGSYTAAHLACSLHQSHTGRIATPKTPLQFVSVPLYLGGNSVMILSARGSNPDVIAAMQNAVAREPRRCVVLCFRRGSGLSRIADRHPWIDLIEFSAPWRKDGFLATNSLLAVSVLLMRAYAIAHARTLDLPSTYEPLVDGFNTAARLIQHLRTSARPVLRRDNLLVLHGSTAQPAAIDLESKFAEAGLGAVQVADYRNFAHGRHNWISSRASSTSVLAFFSKDEEALARKTLSLLPKHVPVAAIALPAGRQSATIAGLISVLHVVGAVAAGKGVDPGRPHVASFGRRLYRMPVLKSKRVTQSHAEIAIGRKVACDPTTVGSRSDVEFWQAAYDRFCEILTQATFGALVCDYDGTLCDERDRFTALPPVMAASLTKVVQAGVSVGIATGRGKSVREALRTALPQKTWERIWVGYYNGADIALLANDDRPDTSRDPEETFGPICRLLKDHPVITRLAKCEFRPEQISIQPRSAASLESIWRLVVGLAETHRLKAFRSTHSIDLVNAGVSKNRLLIALAKMIPAEQRVLVIGDRGAWPGNDRELLRWPYSLCVDEVSGDPETCWNLAPSGCRGQSATIRYFRSFDFSGSTFRIRVRDLERNSQVEDR